MGAGPVSMNREVEPQMPSQKVETAGHLTSYLTSFWTHCQMQVRSEFLAGARKTD